MNYCPRCGIEMLGYNENCSHCGYNFQRQASAETKNPLAGPQNTSCPGTAQATICLPRPTTSQLFQDYLSFKIWIGPATIRIIYIIGALFGTLGIASMFLLNTIVLVTVGAGSGMMAIFMASVFFIVIFNIFWRLSCELCLLRYKIHENLNKLTENEQKNIHS